MRNRNRVVGASLAWVAVSLVASSCTLALGIDPDEYSAVADVLCACTDLKYAFSDCRGRVRDSLDAATDEERQAWLETYESEACGKCSDTVVSCLQQAPVCRATGEECAAVFDCCGVLDQDQACVSGHCGSCVETGGACKTSSECCDVFTGNTYCYEGKCQAQAPDCKHTLEKCSKTSECCGSEITKALCVPGIPSYCIEACANEDAPNCPGCCGHGGDSGQDSICIDGPAVAAQLGDVTDGATACDLTCWLGVDEKCDGDRTCQKLAADDGDGLQLCLEPGSQP